MSKLLPLVFGLLGLGAGAGVAFVSQVGDEAAAPETADKKDQAETTDKNAFEYIRLTNQFVIPIIEDEVVVSMVVLSLSLEVEPGLNQKIYALEPKLRDAFIRVLFDHANMGGFGKRFTDVEMLNLLRSNLRDVAYRELGDVLNDVLIIDLARQDV